MDLKDQVTLRVDLKDPATLRAAPKVQTIHKAVRGVRAVPTTLSDHLKGVPEDQVVLRVLAVLFQDSRISPEMVLTQAVPKADLDP